MPLFGFLLVWSVVVSAPLILVLLAGRRRINRTAGSALLAFSFAAATSYTIWRFEWYDVWRHGTPGASQLFIYGCYAAAYGLIGWFFAKAILCRSHRQSRALAGRN
jgi:hypothetical protein